MKVVSFVDSFGCLVFNSTLDKNDRRLLRKQTYLQKTDCYFSAEGGINRSRIHPDVEATLAYMIYGIFTADTFIVDRGVSQHFADTFNACTNKTISPVNPELAPRSVNTQHQVHGLAFSGGVDSCAALWMLPKDESVAVFIKRDPTIPDKKHKGKAAQRSCEVLSSKGYKIEQVISDFETVRYKIGFPVDWSIYTGMLVLTDRYDFISSNCGMVFESAFRIGHSFFSDLETRKVFFEWCPLFEAIGMPVSFPTSITSEVLTSKIVVDHCADWKSQSCVLGGEKPCGKCVKCFRKTILDAKISGNRIPAEYYNVVNRSSVVNQFVSKDPIKHENVFAYSLLDNPPLGESAIYSSLLEKIAPRQLLSRDYGFLERIYTPGLKYIHPQLHEHILNKLHLIAEDMTQDDIAFLENWDVR